MVLTSRVKSLPLISLLFLPPAWTTLQPQNVQAQRDTAYRSTSERSPGCPDASSSLRCGDLPTLTGPAAAKLRNDLATQPESSWDKVLRDYFKQLYSPSFTDWVVFISGDGTIRQALLADGEFKKNNKVRGKQYLYVLVFADSNLKTPTTDEGILKAAKERATQLKPTAYACRALQLECTVAVTGSGKDAPAIDGGPSGALLFGRSTILYTREPALGAFLKGISKGIVGDGAGSSPAVVPDSTLGVELTDIVRDPDGGTRLYAGQARLFVPENSVARFSLRPNDGHEIKGSQGIFRSVANGSPRRFGASLSLGATLSAPDTSFALATDTLRTASRDSALIVSSRTSSFRPNLWVLAQYAFKPALLPEQRISVSAVVGTNVGISDLFRDFLIGISFDRLVGNDIGLAGGANFIERTTAEPSDFVNGRFTKVSPRTYRGAEPWLGLTFIF